MSELIQNSSQRLDTLKTIVSRLHQGHDPETVRSDLRELVQACEPGEIVAMEQALMDDGVSAQQIQSMCDLHSQVVGEILVDQAEQTLPAGHPVQTLCRENEAIAETVAELRQAVAALGEGADDTPVDDEALMRCRTLLATLMDVRTHYDRKENLLFPYLERYGVTGPTQVMWGKDDEVRDLLRGLEYALAAEGTTAAEWRVVAETVAEGAFDAVLEMIRKEEKILLPTALRTLSDEDWAEIHRQEPQFGWCIVDPGDDYDPAATRQSDDTAEPEQRDGVSLPIWSSQPARGLDEPKQGTVYFPTGALSHAQLLGIFRTLPVDVTFVDEHDTVRFFSEGQHRVFARPKAVIGRKVQHCHPPASTHIVDRILEDFRSGRQDVAEFWIELGGRFVHIQYFAVRDEEKRYLGTLEVTQDATHLRGLTGERRLLQYDN
jgi:hypothetical protein